MRYLVVIGLLYGFSLFIFCSCAMKMLCYFIVVCLVCSLIVAAVSHYHTSDSRRSYQIIKFLVNIASRCMPAKDYLLQTTSRWQWAVNWLRSKVCSVEVLCSD